MTFLPVGESCLLCYCLSKGGHPFQLDSQVEKDKFKLLLWQIFRSNVYGSILKPQKQDRPSASGKNSVLQIQFFKFRSSNSVHQIPFIKFRSSNSVCQLPLIKFRLSNSVLSMDPSTRPWAYLRLIPSRKRMSGSVSCAIWRLSVSLRESFVFNSAES